MALMEMNYYSKALNSQVAINVILPEVNKKQDGVGAIGTTYKTLYLLHGLSDNCNSWIRFTAIERYAKDYNIAVVMPSVGRSWYSDTAYDANFFTFITKELPEVCQGYFKGMSERREDNFVAGLSMGGYGAMKAFLTHPETYGGCASLSGSLDITRKGRPYNINEWRGNFGFDIPDALALEGTKNDLFALLHNYPKADYPNSKFFMWCGTEDPLIKINRVFDKTLEELNIDHVYTESEGDHSWKWWDLHIQDVLAYLFK